MCVWSRKEPATRTRSWEIVDAALEEIYAALKRGESVSLRNSGFFYVRPEAASWVFRFNPAQRLRGPSAEYYRAVGTRDIGHDDDSFHPAFVQAIDAGGMIWEGDPSYPTLE